MITIENLNFLKEEVLVTKPKQNTETGNPFTNNALPQDKSSYVLYDVVKVGEKQEKIKKGDKVLISEQLLQEIRIKDQGVLENIFRIPNSDQIFAVHVEFKE